MVPESPLDRLAFAVVNTRLYLRHWRQMKAAHRRHGWWPDVARAGRYSERMLWRKLVDRGPRLVCFADKLASKQFIRERAPGLAVPRTLWEGVDADAIPDSLLRDDVYVKANNACDRNFRTRGAPVDRAELKRLTDGWLAARYGVRDHESAYWQVVPRLFVEEAVGDAEEDLLEFQIRVADGRFCLGSVIGHAKSERQWAAYLDEHGAAKSAGVARAAGLTSVLPAGVDIAGPYREAVAHACRLGVGVDYARFDFMWNGRQLYGGEITIYPAAGITEILDPVVNRTVLDAWRLELSGFLSGPVGGAWRFYADALRRRLAAERRERGRAVV